jgi:hypothetical protein
MTALLGLIAIAGLVGLIIGVIALFRPLPKLKLATRGRAGLLVGGSLALLAVVGALAPPDTSPSTKSQVADSAPKPDRKPAGYVVGQPLDIGDFRVIIRNVSARDAVGRSIVREQASAGGVLVVVEYTVENISDQPKAAYQLPAPSLIGPNNVVYDKDLGKTAAYASEGELDSKAMSDLNPGIQVNNAVVFEVSKASFDRDTWMLGLGAGNRLRVSMKADDHPEVARRDWGDCSKYEAAADQVFCANPDLARRDEILAAKVARHQKLHPDDQMTEIAKLSEEAMACADRACVAATYDRLEELMADWPTS